MTETTDLILPESTTLATLLSSKGGIDPIIDKIAERVRSEAAGIDVSSKSGRDRLKSLAHNVSRSKTEIERQADILKEDAQKLIKSVNAEVNTARTKCDALRDEIKAPALAWESAEQERINKIKQAMQVFNQKSVHESSADIKYLIDKIFEIEIDSSWQEFKLEAKSAKDKCLLQLREKLASAIAREEAQALAERQAAELEQLRREKAEREEQDRLLAIARAEEARRIEQERVAHELRMKQAEEEARRRQQEKDDAFRRQAEIEKAEAERLAKIEKDKQEAARIAVEKAEKESAEREAALKKQAEEEKIRHEREMAEAKAREEAAAQRERDRIAAERQAEADARAKREADAKHRENIRGEIMEALVSFGLDHPSGIADALMDGKIPHCKVIL